MTRYAISTPNVGDPAWLIELATSVERAGWDAFFLWDHMHLVRDLALDVFDPWVTLGAVARETERVRVGTMVTPVPRRRPWKLAKEVVTVDHLSGGRITLGVGLGEPAADEFAAFGEPTGLRDRAVLLDEGLALLDRFLRGEPVRHDGEAFSVDAHLRPGCVQRPRPPIWVAGKWPNRRPLERAARWDGVMPIGRDGGPISPDDLRSVVDLMQPPGGFDVVATAAPGVPWDEYEDAGATWIVESGWPAGDWQADLAAQAVKGPAGR
jgi:alkanesulfonate monooxygenase SsuD/methylene tetrahydromethanopterin reductase-like flavin-dependent oxidoreductase (luciferase family)